MGPGEGNKWRIMGPGEAQTTGTYVPVIIMGSGEAQTTDSQLVLQKFD